MHGIFLLWTVLSEQFSAWAIADSQRVAMPKINRESLKSIPIAIPPLAHQIKIAAFLDRETAKIDGLVGEQRRLIELLCEERRVIILKCVTRGLEDRVSLKPFGMAGCGDVPINWAVGRVKSICTFITSGPRGWSERVGDEGALFIQSGDLDDALQVQFTGAKRVQVEDDAESARTRVSEGDVLICVTGAKTGNVGVCTAIPEPAYVNQHLCLIRPGRRMLPAFLGNLLKCDFGQRQLALAQYGLKQGLSLEDVACIPVLIPPLVEQTAIVDHLRITTARLDELVAAADQAITVLQERRTALISAAVTGKIDVRGLA
jgi:type I restriction enzyme S subunit